MNRYYTYIIFSKATDRFYTGHTSNTPPERLNQHNNAMSPSTKFGIPWKIMFVKSFESKTQALEMEQMIKRQKSRTFIQRLIDSDENEFQYKTIQEPRSVTLVMRANLRSKHFLQHTEYFLSD